MSLLFNGTSDQIAYGVHPNVATFSLAAWIYPTSDGEGNEGRILQCNFRPGIGFNAAGTHKLRFSWIWSTGDRTVDLTSAISLNAWTHLAAVYDPTGTGNTWTVYVNGAAVSTTDIGGTPSGSAGTPGNAFIGGDGSGGRTWAGNLAEEAIWSGKLLTASEVAAVYTLGVQAVPDSLWLYAPHDGATGQDCSGNARTGTLTGTTLAENPPIRPAGRRG